MPLHLLHASASSACLCMPVCAASAWMSV
jgi:hypothetical protein